MTTARRTSLIHHLRLDIGYEQDVSPAVLTSAILEALEPALIDEMGIVSVQANDPLPDVDSTLTIYAPVDAVKREGEAPPQTPLVLSDEDAAAEEAGNPDGEETDRKPNVG